MLRRLLLLTLTLLLVFAVSPFARAQTDCDFSFSNYARAVQLHDMGDYARALRHYHCALQEDPDDAIIPLLIQNVHEDIANAPLAWTRNESAATATACDPALDHARLGAEAQDTGDDSLARIHLECVLLADPTQVEALNRMGYIHINRGETHEAKHYFDRADRAAAEGSIDADERDLFVYLLGEDARAVLDADALDELTLTSPDPGAAGEYLPPGREYMTTYLIVIWTRRGERDEARGSDEGDAIGRLERALEQAPTRVDLRCELGRLYKARGDYAAAYGQFSTLIRERLGDHCAGEMDPEGASGALPGSASAAVAAERVSPAEQAYAEGMRDLEAGRLYRAANIFLGALELDPLHLGARCRLGVIYAEWSHYRGALEQFDLILERDPQNSCARRNRTAAAREMLAILTPLVVDDYFHYARTYVKMGEWELARDAFLEGLAIDPARYDVRCELGMLYAQLGDDRAALNEFDLALFGDETDSCAWSNRDALLRRLRDG